MPMNYLHQFYSFTSQVTSRPGKATKSSTHTHGDHRRMVDDAADDLAPSDAAPLHGWTQQAGDHWPPVGGEPNYVEISERRAWRALQLAMDGLRLGETPQRIDPLSPFWGNIRDNFRCNQWRKFRQNDVSVSMYETLNIYHMLAYWLLIDIWVMNINDNIFIAETPPYIWSLRLCINLTRLIWWLGPQC